MKNKNLHNKQFKREERNRKWNEFHKREDKRKEEKKEETI